MIKTFTGGHFTVSLPEIFMLDQGTYIRKMQSLPTAIAGLVFLSKGKLGELFFYAHVGCWSVMPLQHLSSFQDEYRLATVCTHGGFIVPPQWEIR